MGQTDILTVKRTLMKAVGDLETIILTVRRPQRILYRAVTNIMLYLEAKTLLMTAKEV